MYWVVSLLLTIGNSMLNLDISDCPIKGWRRNFKFGTEVALGTQMKDLTTGPVFSAE